MDFEMPSAIELSNFAGLGAFCILSLNLLLGLVLSVKYNPVREWPHRHINTVRIHDWSAWLGLGLALLHPVIVLFSETADLDFIDIVFPVNAPRQPTQYVFGALTLYTLIFIVLTSYLWKHQRVINRRWWRAMHYATYAFLPLMGIHAIFTEPSLKDNKPIDWFDGEKVLTELGTLLLVAALAWRIRYRMLQPPPRVHRPKVPRPSGAAASSG